MRIIQTFIVVGSLYLLQYIYLQEQEKECECSNERPIATPDYSCVQLAAWGKCEKSYLEGYCNASCNNCDCLCEDKLPDDGGANCQKRKEWGACEKAWMIEGFYCAKTCGFCSSESDATSKSIAVSDGTPKAPVASQTRSTTPATPFIPPTTQPYPTHTVSPSWNSISTLLPSPTAPQTNLQIANSQTQLRYPTQDFAPTPPRTPTLATSLVQTPTQLSISQELPAPVVTPTPITPTKLEGQLQLGTSAEPTPEPVNVAPITPSTVPNNPPLYPTVVPVAPSLTPTPTLTPTPSIIPADPTPSIIPADPTLAVAPTPTVTPLAATPAPIPVPLAPTLTPTVMPSAPTLAPSTVPLGPTLIPGAVPEMPLTNSVVPTSPTLASSTVPLAQNPPVVASDTVVSTPDLVPQIPSVSTVTPTVAPTIPTPTPTPNVDGISAPVVNPRMDATVVSNPVIGGATALPGTALNADSALMPVDPALTPAVPTQAEIPVESEIVPLAEEAPQPVSLAEIFGEDSYENRVYNFESIAAVDMYNQVIQDALAQQVVISQQQQQQSVQQEEDLMSSAVQVDPTSPMSTAVTAQEVVPEVVSTATTVPQVVPTPALPNPIIAAPITTTEPTPVTAPGQCNTVYDIMSTDPDLSVSFEIWNRVRDMQSQGYDDPNIPFTVFVPVNAAWNNYTLERSTSLEELMNDTPLLERLVTFHELPEPTLSTDWKHGLNLRSELRDIYDKRIIVLVGMPEGPEGEIILLAETQALVVERDINACAAVLMKLNDIMVPSGARLPPLPSTIN